MEFRYEKRKIQHMSIVTCDAENFDEKKFPFIRTHWRMFDVHWKYSKI